MTISSASFAQVAELEAAPQAVALGEGESHHLGSPVAEQGVDNDDDAFFFRRPYGLEQLVNLGGHAALEFSVAEVAHENVLVLAGTAA